MDIWTGDTLEIHRVRREDMGAYLCIASNKIPPSVSKRITLVVECEWREILDQTRANCRGRVRDHYIY